MFAQPQPSQRGLGRILLILILLVLVGGAAVLAVVDLQPERAVIERVIPNDRFN